MITVQTDTCISWHSIHFTYRLLSDKSEPFPAKDPAKEELLMSWVTLPEDINQGTEGISRVRKVMVVNMARMEAIR